ncbi:hypothetical protein TNCV_1399971 [Trichonephila clavipes]|nr:hypothetical protein TNCV_1399971 [Trichonephila clavipes]
MGYPKLMQLDVSSRVIRRLWDQSKCEDSTSTRRDHRLLKGFLLTPGDPCKYRWIPWQIKIHLAERGIR